MSSRNKVHDDLLPHFVPSTVVARIDALSREQYKKITCDSLRFCIERKGLLLHAWVIMPNHVHLIRSCSGAGRIPAIMRDFKKFTSRKIVTEIAENSQESRKGWMLNMFRFAADTNRGAEDY
jgi:putative transposase